MIKISFYNDTGRSISIHPGSVECNTQKIKPLESCVFQLPSHTSPFLKLWDHKDYGLSLLVQATDGD